MKKRYVILIGIVLLAMIPILFFINLEILKSYLLWLFLTAFVIISLFFIIDIQAIAPKTVKERHSVVEMQYHGRKVFILNPKNKSEIGDVILYLHGGSYVIEATYKHWKFLEDLVADTGMTLILPDYPLTPKYTYKEVFEMIEPLYMDITKKIDNRKLILMGDSAGGGMALALAEKISNMDVRQPDKTILLSPWLDVTLSNPKITKELQQKDPRLIKDVLKVAGVTYAGKEGMDNYLVNPIVGPIKNLKNVTLYIGTYDILNPDAHTFLERAEKENVHIDFRETEKAIHIWMTYREKKQYASEETYQDIVKLVKEVKKNEG